MKKIAFGVVTLGMCMGILTGCSIPMLSPEGETPTTPAEKTGIELVKEMCEKLPEAKKIEQTIEVRSADGAAIVQYESAKTFVKGTEGYTVTGTVKRLNDLEVGGEEAYTETKVEETLSAGKYSVQLDLNELYFSPAPTFKDGILTGSVRDISVESLLGLREELPSAPHGMKLKVTTGSGHVTGIGIDYSAASSTVEILLIFSY